MKGVAEETNKFLVVRLNSPASYATGHPVEQPDTESDVQTVSSCVTGQTGVQPDDHKF